MLSLDISQLWFIQFLRFLTDAPQGQLSSFVIIFFAAISYHIGQSFILLINHVTPRRFFFSLITSILLYTLGVYLWILSLATILRMAFNKPVTFTELTTIIAVAYIPRLFDILILLPHFGTLTAKLLSILCFLLLTFLLEFYYSLTLTQALSCSSLGFLMTSFFQHSIGSPYIRITRFLKQRLSV